MEQRARWRSESGISATELAVVLMIIAVLAAAAVPFLQNLQDVMGAKGASEEVAGAVRLARQYAITRGANHCVEFLGNPTTFTIRQTTSDTDCNSGTVVQSATPIGHNLAVVTFTPSLGTQALVFNPVGAARNIPVAGQRLQVGKDAASCPRNEIQVTLFGGVRVYGVC
jgi:Tfp pilus assembly protein FimT